MATLARLDILLGMNTSKFFRDMKSVQRRLRKTGRELKSMGRGLTMGLTMPMVAAGTQSVKMSATFDESMTKVVTLVGISREQVDKWGKSILELAPKVGKAPKDLAEGLFFVTSAGIRGTRALETLEVAAKASALGLGDTATAADIITSAMNAYGQANMTAARAGDVLVATVREGKAYAEDLAPVMGRLLPIANELGISFEEVGASMAGLTRVGLPAAEAATSIRMIMTALIKPTGKSAEALQGVGLNLAKLRQEVDEKGLLPALLSLKEKFGENIEASGKMFSRVRALTGVLSLTGANAEKATEIFDSMKDSTEDLNRAFEELVTRPMQKFRMALAQVQVGSVKLGDVLMVYVLPAVTKIAEFIGVLVEGFKTLEPGIRKTILGFAAFAMLAGPLIFGLGVIATILGSISVVTISVAAGFAALSIGAVMYWDEIKTGAIALWQALKPLFTYLADHVKAQFQKIKDFAVDIWPSIVQIGKKVIGIMKVLWDKYGSQVKAVLIVSLTFITEVSSAILTILIGSLKVLILVLNGEFKAAWLAAKATALQANKDMEQSTLNLAQSISWYFWESMREIALAAKWLADTMIDIMRGIANNPLMIGPLKKWVDGYIDYLHGQKKAYGDHAKEIAKIQDQIGQNFSARLNEQVPKVTAAFEEIKAATTTAVLELKAIPEKQPIQFVEWSKKGAASLKGGFGVIKEAAKTEIQGIQQIADENPINLKFLWVDANGNIIEPPGGQEATLP